MNDNNIDDNFIPGVQTDPLKGYEDLIDVLDPATGRMIGLFGILGMTIEEATRHAEAWWGKARYQMPDYGKDQKYLEAYGMKSGVLLGRAWYHLNRGEKIHVVKQWHTHIGIPKHGMGFSNNQKKDYENVVAGIERENRIRSFDLPKLFGAPEGETQQ